MAVVFEVYFANFQHDDIDRESVGGVVGADRVVLDAPVHSRHKDPTQT